MFVSPSIPMVVGTPEVVATIDEVSGNAPGGPPRVALLDGLPLANHSVLQGRLIIDDPDDFTARYGAARRGHGTAMASLICHGDLSEEEAALTAPIYVRPLLQPHHIDPNQETTPPDLLLVDLVHRCFVRMFEGDGAGPAVAPSVRVINLSIGDPARVFARQMSPLARLLDWLAHKYNRIVIVSAGNHAGRVSASHDEVAGDLSEARAAVAVRLRDQAAHRRMLSPAEAINVLTVGSVHSDGSTSALPGSVIDLVEPGAPAAYTPAGTGYRRAVKPDLLLPGGRQVHLRPPPGAGLGALSAANALGTGPGLQCAGHGAAGSLDGTVFTAGTSNSAALASRQTDRVLELLTAMAADSEIQDVPDGQYHPVLAKAMLVHAAGWGDAGEVLRQQLGIDGYDARKELVQLLGYGPVDVEKILTADRVRAVLLGASSIGKNQRRTFRFPLPPSLSAATLWRRLTLTVAWLSPINVRSQKYRMARLVVAPPSTQLALHRVEVPHFAPGRGTVYHEILDGDDAAVFQSGDSLEVNVDCRVDAGALQAPVRFGLIASLELAEGVVIDVQAEVRQQLRIQARQPVRARANPRS